MTVDPRAVSGFAGAAGAYERGRPSYPAGAVASVATALGLTRAGTAVDLAAGTGKLSRMLVPLAGRVIAVDPLPAMLAVLRERLPTVEAVRGSAEAIPVAEKSVDAVFAGEAFHWFRTAEACAEIARVLVPGGGLALLWNRARWTEAELPWLAEFDALVKPHRRAAGPFPGEEWRLALDETRLFAPLTTTEADHVHRVSPDDLVALVSSWSWIANLPHGERAELLERVRDLAGDVPQLALNYRTEIHWTRLR